MSLWIGESHVIYRLGVYQVDVPPHIATTRSHTSEKEIASYDVLILLPVVYIQKQGLDISFCDDRQVSIFDSDMRRPLEVPFYGAQSADRNVSKISRMTARIVLDSI